MGWLAVPVALSHRFFKLAAEGGIGLLARSWLSSRRGKGVLISQERDAI